MGPGRKIERPGVDDVFSALSDSTRRQVMSVLSQQGAASASELSEIIPVTRQAIAKHLAALDQAGLVSSERQGRQVRFRLTPEPLAGAMSWMVDVGAEWDARLAALRRVLDKD